MFPAAAGPDLTESRELLTISSNSNSSEVQIISSEQECMRALPSSNGIHMRSGSATEVAVNTVAVSVINQHSSLHSVEQQHRGSGHRFTGDSDERNWNFFDERMKNLRRLLQMTFLADMFTYQQASVNRRLGLAKYSDRFSEDPRSSVGFGTLIRWSLYVLCVCTMMAMIFKPLFILPKNDKGDSDYTQLPVKLAFLFFCFEVITTMLLFSRAASSFESRHISRSTVRKMSTGILIFSCFLFWITYSIVFFSFIFFRSGHLVAASESPNEKFPRDMYRMHKVWTSTWIDEPAFLFLYSSAMFIAFAIYIVSVSYLGYFATAI
jgi:hypothetical protein